MALTNFSAGTPQLEAVKNLIEAYFTLDLSNLEPFITKDYKFETFPKIADLPDESKGGHLERYGTLFSLMTKLEHVVHEVIEAPGKVVIHHTVTFHTIDGDEFDYDSLGIFTLVEENGELKVADIKDFSDPEKRGKVHGWAAKTLAKRAT